MDPYWSDFEDLSSRINELGSEDRKRLLVLVTKALGLEEVRRVEELRVGVVKVVVALAPESAALIRNWLVDHSGSYIHELHFTLFCFLDRVLELPDASDLGGEIGKLLENYLLQIRTQSAQAAWMAGDLLGDHWPLNESLPILEKAIIEARFVAGRLGGIHGLSHALARLPPARRRPVISLLRIVSKSDVSGVVRTSARLVLEGTRDKL